MSTFVIKSSEQGGWDGSADKGACHQGWWPGFKPWVLLSGGEDGLSKLTSDLPNVFLQECTRTPCAHLAYTNKGKNKILSKHSEQCSQRTFFLVREWRSYVARSSWPNSCHLPEFSCACLKDEHSWACWLLTFLHRRRWREGHGTLPCVSSLASQPVVCDSALIARGPMISGKD